MLSMTAPAAVADGIRPDTFRWSPVIGRHVVPFVLYSIKLETPETVSPDTL